MKRNILLLLFKIVKSKVKYIICEYLKKWLGDKEE